MNHVWPSSTSKPNELWSTPEMCHTGIILILFGDPGRLYITIYGNLTQKWRPGSDNVPFLYEPLEWVIAKIYFFSHILSPSKLSVWVSARSKQCFFIKLAFLQAILNYHNFHTSSLYHTPFNDWIAFAENNSFLHHL